uniref:Uncharacterized protein n=1 Tax=Clandestinovirus TaxID=2831644 RepID=A0A8F8KSN8_9VIRU|nr:hypothetical protein KOM_12_105 [Clandestinovirus]
MASSVNTLYVNMIDAGFNPAVDTSGLQQVEVLPKLIFSLHNWTEGKWYLSTNLGNFNTVVFSYLQRKEDQQYGQVHVENWQQMVHVITKLNICNPNAFLCWNYQPWKINGFPFMDLLPADKYHAGLLHYSKCAALSQLPILREYARLLTFITNRDYRSDIVMMYAYEFYQGGKFNPLFSTLYLVGKVWYADMESILLDHPNIQTSQFKPYFPNEPVSIKVFIPTPNPKSMAEHNSVEVISEDDNFAEYISSDEVCDSDPASSPSSGLNRYNFNPTPDEPINVTPDPDLYATFKMFMFSNNLQQKQVAYSIKWSQSTLSGYIKKHMRAKGWNAVERDLRKFMGRYNKPVVQ